MSKEQCERVACAKKTSIGGQALIEGIMMRGPERTAMAVRDPDGEIVLEKWDNGKPKHTKIYKIPFIRGMFNFIASMKIGYKCLMRSAEIAGLDEEEPKSKKKAEEQTPEAIEQTEEKAKKQEKKATRCTVVLDWQIHTLLTVILKQRVSLTERQSSVLQHELWNS